MKKLITESSDLGGRAGLVLGLSAVWNFCDREQRDPRTDDAWFCFGFLLISQAVNHGSSMSSPS